MTSTLFDEEARASILSRLDRLSPAAQRLWGTMNPGQMVCHLSDHLGVALGTVASTPAPAATSNPLMRWFIIRLMPWPKGKLDSPKEQFTTKPGDFTRDRATLKSLIEQFAERGSAGNFGAHSIFGRMSGTRWGQLAHRHIDFHLRQFGV
jgi:hypothetical protein